MRASFQIKSQAAATFIFEAGSNPAHQSKLTIPIHIHTQMAHSVQGQSGVKDRAQGHTDTEEKPGIEPLIFRLVPPLLPEPQPPHLNLDKYDDMNNAVNKISNNPPKIFLLTQYLLAAKYYHESSECSCKPPLTCSSCQLPVASVSGDTATTSPPPKKNLVSRVFSLT